jgi:hypothetical protein
LVVEDACGGRKFRQKTPTDLAVWLALFRPSMAKPTGK